MMVASTIKLSFVLNVLFWAKNCRKKKEKNFGRVLSFITTYNSLSPVQGYPSFLTI